uniref:Uncharacterized protein n=1 Tax=Nelumbo nucifera TaxID=4432 RepID=A0A822ZSR6_NELNU|nr:TPA_asm: hypothetical protein HUJ06_017487 [Nelumbo nucifera]
MVFLLQTPLFIQMDPLLNTGTVRIRRPTREYLAPRGSPSPPPSLFPALRSDHQITVL